MLSKKCSRFVCFEADSGTRDLILFTGGYDACGYIAVTFSSSSPIHAVTSSSSLISAEEITSTEEGSSGLRISRARCASWRACRRIATYAPPEKRK
jgi:hypothetical protein